MHYKKISEINLIQDDRGVKRSNYTSFLFNAKKGIKVAVYLSSRQQASSQGLEQRFLVFMLHQR